MSDTQIILGIETSCDETAASIVRLENGVAQVLSSIIASQIKDHAPYGGVVPEIAARKHVEKIDVVIKHALNEANISLNDLSGIAATSKRAKHCSAEKTAETGLITFMVIWTENFRLLSR